VSSFSFSHYNRVHLHFMLFHYMYLSLSTIFVWVSHRIFFVMIHMCFFFPLMMHCTENSLPVPSIFVCSWCECLLFSFFSSSLLYVWSMLLFNGRASYRQKVQTNKRTKTKQKRSITIVLCCPRTRVCAIKFLLLTRWFLLSISIFFVQKKKLTNFSFSLSNNLSSTCSVCVMLLAIYLCMVVGCVNQYI